MFVTRQPTAATCLLTQGGSQCWSAHLSCGHYRKMNINAWIFAAGLAVLFWLLPVESSRDLDSRQAMRQVQLALQQFETFKEAKTFEDISFSMRVNRKYLPQTFALLTISDHPSCLLDQFIVTGI